MRGRDARLNLYGAVSVLLVTAFFVGLGTAAGVEIETAEPSAAKIAATDDLLYESFEEDFPSDLWRVEHPSTAADVEWGRTDYRASEGRFSIYCAGMGGDAPGDGGPAPAATASWAIAGPYDLSETTTATLTFDLWLQTEQFRDVFMWLVSTDGESFSGSARSTDTNDWQTVTTDLDNWGAAGSVIGEDRVWIAFVYQSDHSNLFEGAYVDEVRLTVDTGDPAGSGYTYTSNSDFALGDMVGVESTSNRLELTDEWDTYPYVWIPNSTSGTVSKVGTDAGDELARYAVGPDSEANPGVAAVDLDGACWVGNKGLGTVVKIGLEENGGCIDRSGNGVIETSRDINGDGDISGNEVFDWGEDECVLVEVVLAKGSEGTYTPGEAHEAYEANNLQAVAVDAAGDVWAGVHDSRMLYLIDGDTGLIADQVDVDGEVSNPTSTVVDRNGTVWISSWPDPWILALEPETEETFRFDLSHGSSGLAMNEVNGLYITGFEHSAMSSFDTVDSTVIWDREAGWQARGVATTDDGRIWVAAGEGTLRVYNVVGRETNTVPMAGGSTGVAVDQDGKVWVVGSQTDFVYRVDSLFVDPVLEKEILGSGGHDATGDLTGIVVRNLTSKFGSWTVIYDSENPGTNWGRISWQAVEPDGTGVAVRVRSSDGQEIWSGWETATNDADLSITPSGRYLQIQASLQQTTGDELPRLEELTVLPAEDQTPPTSDFSWTPESPQAGEQIEFTDTSTGAPTSWSWDFGDTATSDLQNPTHTYSGEGSYEVTLIAANGVGSDSSSQTIEVGSGVVCAPVCEATVPMTGDVNEAVSFQATVNAPGCAGDITYAWTFGDGSGSAEQNPAHEYGSTGTLRWGLTATVDGESCGRSGDITIVGDGPTACTSTYWVPVASRSEGANGSVWRTDLGLLGRDLHGAAVELRLHTDGGAVSRVVTVASLAMVQLVDVVGWIEPGLEASGALEVCSDGQLAVTSRTYNLLAGDHDCFPGGSFGQFLAGESSDVGLSTGKLAWLSQLRESEAFRTNIGLVNTGTEPATVEIRLYDASGVELDVFDVELEPGRWFQENRPFFRAGRGDLDAASASVKVLTGAGVFAYGSVIDNLTNDATTVPMKR